MCMGPGRKKYAAGTVDFFAVWVIPMGEWYIIPYEAMGERLTLHFTPGSKRSKWGRYREAWDLMRVVEIQACADPMFLEEGVGGMKRESPDEFTEEILTTEDTGDTGEVKILFTTEDTKEH